MKMAQTMRLSRSVPMALGDATKVGPRRATNSALIMSVDLCNMPIRAVGQMRSAHWWCRSGQLLDSEIVRGCDILTSANTSITKYRYYDINNRQCRKTHQTQLKCAIYMSVISYCPSEHSYDTATCELECQKAIKKRQNPSTPTGHNFPRNLGVPSFRSMIYSSQKTWTNLMSSIGYTNHFVRTGIFKRGSIVASAGKRRTYVSDTTAQILAVKREESDDCGTPSQPGGPIVQNLEVSPQRSPDQQIKFWSHRMYKTPDGNGITVHYCRSLKSAEEVAQLFLHDKVLGFDLEWKAQASTWDGIQNNVSLIQIASQERIALFHIAMFRPARGVDDFICPSLRVILESPHITKVGVSIKADSTRVRKYLGINTRAIFELSHLHKLIKYCYSNPRLINKRLVNLSEQVEEHFGLPLEKEEDVRCGDWAHALNYRQVQYAAADPFACICLFYQMDSKRKALDPIPPLPAHAELDIPIRILHDTPVQTDPDDVEVVRPAGGPVGKRIS